MWLEIVLGLIFFSFAILGVKEGIIKSLLSIVILFLSVLIANSLLQFLSGSVPQLGDPHHTGAIILFIAVTASIFIFLDLILSLVFNKIINISVFGRVDKALGFLSGALKGVLISGIILQALLLSQIPAQAKQQIASAYLSRISIRTYKWGYYYTQKIFPHINKFMQENVIDKIQNNQVIKESTSEKTKEELKKQADKLIKEKKLIPSIPQGMPE